MEIFTVHDLVSAAMTGVKSYLEINGAFAAAIQSVAFKPFSDLSITNLVAALGAAIILWCKKSWIISGLFQLIK